MIIKNLDQMEKIVSRHNNLSWIGWNVRDLKRSESARTAINGVRVNGIWYLERIYPISRNGWDIPYKYKG